MNWFKSKLARLRIKGKWYDWNRRENMIEIAEAFAFEGTRHFPDRWSRYYDLCARKENMYRKRADWYLRRMKAKGQTVK